MNLKTLLEEITFPARSLTCVLAMAGFFLLLSLVAAAGILGIWLAIVVLPALFRYLIMVAEARAMGKDVEPPGIEYFSWAGNIWSLFPVVPVLFFVQLTVLAIQSSAALGIAVGLFALAVLPAIMAVLVITHSPLQCLNPSAWMRLIVAVGPGYLFAPVVAFAIAWVPMQLSTVPQTLQSIFELYLAFVFYAVTGAMIRERQLLAEIDIPIAYEVGDRQDDKRLAEERTLTLNHAYALASRGNRDGALAHLDKWIAEDPSPDAAWPWFFEQMQQWQDCDLGLYFAQRYLHELLDAGDDLRAVKLILRCRLQDEAFRPLADDLPLAIAAAYRCHNGELAEALEMARS